MFAPKRILVPTDFTKDSDRALQEAVDIAKVFHAKVFLLHVDRDLQTAAGGDALGLDVLQEAAKSDERFAQERMQDEVRKIAQEADLDIEIEERHGRTHEEILGYGTEKGVDLIVIEPHAKHGLLKSLLGGVTDRLVHRARAPVLVLH
jgi:nucleotide-binding universal stress UspA family protein